MACAFAAVEATAAQQHVNNIVERAEELEWSTAGKPRLNSLFDNKDTVLEFLNELEFGVADTGFVDVIDYRIVDLNGDGWVELVAIPVSWGNEVHNDIEIVSHRGAGMAATALNATRVADFYRTVIGGGVEIQDLESVVRDIDGDGVDEMLIPSLLDEYRGDRPLATSTEIYKYRDRRYVNVSGDFGWYYDSVILPRLQLKLGELNAAPLSQNEGTQARSQAEKETLMKEIAEAKKRAMHRQQ